MYGDVTKAICDYMNSQPGSRNYRLLEVNIIRESMRYELINRNKENIVINTKTMQGRNEINKRAAQIANSRLGKDRIKPDDVRLYKKCRLKEYEKRTGKCCYGFPSVRERYGFNPKTGLEEDS